MNPDWLKHKRFLKLRMMWNIARGRPVCYRIRIVKGRIDVKIDDPRTYIVDCSFYTNDIAVKVDV